MDNITIEIEIAQKSPDDEFCATSRIVACMSLEDLGLTTISPDSRAQSVFHSTLTSRIEPSCIFVNIDSQNPFGWKFLYVVEDSSLAKDRAVDLLLQIGSAETTAIEVQDKGGDGEFAKVCQIRGWHAPSAIAIAFIPGATPALDPACGEPNGVELESRTFELGDQDKAELLKIIPKWAAAWPGEADRALAQLIFDDLVGRRDPPLAFYSTRKGGTLEMSVLCGNEETKKSLMDSARDGGKLDKLFVRRPERPC